MKQLQWQRRQFVGAMGVGALLAPFIRPRDAGAQEGSPKRLLIWFTPDGQIEDRWRPTGTENDFELSYILEPLEAFKEQLIVFGANTPDAEADNIREPRGITMHQKPDEPSGEHTAGLILTGVPNRTFDGLELGGGKSIDQVIADEVHGDRPFRSIEMGLRVAGSHQHYTILSYRGPGDPLPAENDPHAMFERLFGNFTPDAADQMQALERKARLKSVLDVVRSDFGALRPRLGTEHRERLDAHVQSVREIERRLDTAASSAAACAVPEIGALTPNRWDEFDNIPQNSRMVLDMMAMAFACDLTRVGSIMWNGAASNDRYPWLGVDASHHGLSHDFLNDPTAADKLADVARWHAGELAYFLDQLSKLPEGNGSVLDNTLVFWCNEIKHGVFHTHQDMPFLLIGDLGGKLNTGRFITYDHKPHNDLLVSIANAMDVPMDTFGDPRFCNGPLPNLS